MRAMTITLEAFLAKIAARKAELGLEDTPERTEALRNKGGSRIPAKREALRRAEKRAVKAGQKPFPAYY